MATEYTISHQDLHVSNQITSMRYAERLGSAELPVVSGMDDCIEVHTTLLYAHLHSSFVYAML